MAAQKSQDFLTARGKTVLIVRFDSSGLSMAEPVCFPIQKLKSSRATRLRFFSLSPRAGRTDAARQEAAPSAAGASALLFCSGLS